MKRGLLLIAVPLGGAAALPLLGGLERGADPLAELRELPVAAQPGSGEANLSVGPDGRVYLSWIDPLPDSAHALRLAVLGYNGWSDPRTVASGRDWFVNWADFPSVAALSQSELAAHWLARSGRGTYAYDVRVSRSTDGGLTWGPAVSPHRDGTESEHGFVSMWPADSGRVAVVWLDGRKFPAAEAARRAGQTAAMPEMTLRHATIGRDGSLAAESELDERACDCCQTAAAVTSAGPIVVYRDRSAAEIRDISVVRLVNGGWTAPQPVARDGWEIPGCPVNGPAAAAEGERVAVAWFTAARQSRRVQVAFSGDAGARFSPPVRVDEGRPVGRVGVVLVDGGALVSWLEETAGGAEVRVRRVAEGEADRSSQVVARTDASRPSGFPRMVRSGSRVVFAWRDPSGEGGGRVRTAVARLAADRR